MGLYNFKPRFVPMIEDWSKRHTIRGERAHPDLPGDIMYNYTGLRHPGARCLMRPMCVRTEYIRIEGGPQTPFRIRMGLSLGTGSAAVDAAAGAPVYGSVSGGPLVRLAEDELQQLAWRDGFRPEGSTLDNPGDAFGLMMAFWDGRLPFEGTVYHWNPARQAAKDPLLGRWRWVDISAPETHDNGTSRASKIAHPAANPPVIPGGKPGSEKRGKSRVLAGFGAAR